MTRKLTKEEKLVRKPASKACVFCHKKHLQCSNERPCKNCVKRGLSDSCTDIQRRRAKYLRQSDHRPRMSSEASSNDIADFPPSSFQSSESQPILQPKPSTQPTTVSGMTSSQGVSFSPQQTINQSQQVLGRKNKSNQQFAAINTTDEVLSKLFSTEMKQSASDYLDNIFDSNYLDQEYKMLGDIITNSKPTSPTPTNSMDTSSVQSNYINPLLANEVQLKDTRPFISFGIPQDSLEDDDSMFPNHNSRNVNVSGQGSAAPEPTQPSDTSMANTNMNVDLTSHLLSKISPKDYLPPMKSHQVYKSVQDIYSNDIIYFDYPQSYHSLTFFLKKRFSGKNLTEEEKQVKRDNLLIILKLIASYRPTFISAHKSLYKPWDLQFLEMTFQRSLLDFEKLANLNSSPTIIWRRTGEIVSISNDLISLLNWNINDLLSKRTFIMELMFDDKSIINYFALFKSVAVGNLHSSIITKCKLIKHKSENPAANNPMNNLSYINKNDEYMEFCSVWTVKRDIFDIPMLILGQFLPILSPTDSFRMY